MTTRLPEDADMGSHNRPRGRGAQERPGSGSDSHPDTVPGYADAMAELEQILADLEADDPDVDVLAAQVERAAFLIGVCRQRITTARLKVERVVSAFEPEDA